mmetsp:Transcript_12795/g.25546  ORF Transcript_12795/g.25546 Transcript_12795/m.25546 type:complete len:103 (-) Transcript_12795:36-344(-)
MGTQAERYRKPEMVEADTVPQVTMTAEGLVAMEGAERRPPEGSPEGGQVGHCRRQSRRMVRLEGAGGGLPTERKGGPLKERMELKLVRLKMVRKIPEVADGC